MQISKELAQQLDNLSAWLHADFKLCELQLPEIPDEKKLAHINAWLRQAAGRARDVYPEAWKHKEAHTAYHEAGHALIRTLLYDAPAGVNIDVAVKCLEDFPDYIRLGGVFYDSTCANKAHECLVLCAGVPASKIFCSCKIAEGGADGDGMVFDTISSFAKLDIERQIELLTSLYDVVSALLQQYKSQLEAIAAQLLELRTLTREQVAAAVKDSKPVPDHLLQGIESIRALLVV